MRHAHLPVLAFALLGITSAAAQTPGITFSQQDLDALAQKQAAQMGTEVIQLNNQVSALQEESTRQKSNIAQLTSSLSVANSKIATDEAEIKQLSTQIVQAQQIATNVANLANSKIATDEARIKQLSTQVVQAQQVAADAANLAAQLQAKIPTNFGYSFGSKADGTEFILQNCKLSSYIRFTDLGAAADDGYIEVKSGCVPTKIPPHTQQ